MNTARSRKTFAIDVPSKHLYAISWLVAASLAVASVSTARAQDVAATFDHDGFETLLRAGRYDHALELAQGLADSTSSAAVRADAYVAIAKTYVLLANSFRSRGDVVTADLYVHRAVEQVKECLSDWETRFTRPPVDREQPPGLLAVFRDARDQTQGGLRVSVPDVESPAVRLDDLSLDVPVEDSLFVAEDLPAGTYSLDVRAEGFEDYSTDVEVSAGQVVRVTVSLRRSRGLTWWLTRAGVLAGAGTAAAVAITQLGDDPAQDPVPEVLPGPPLPPD